MLDVTLTVVEALQNDPGRGIVRIDSENREKLEVSIGDVVEIKGKKSTGAIAWRGYSKGRGIGIYKNGQVYQVKCRCLIGRFL